MTRSHRISRRWCGTHGMYYPAWTDARRVKLGTCYQCDVEKDRADAAAKRRAERAAATKAGDAHE